MIVCTLIFLEIFDKRLVESVVIADILQCNAMLTPAIHRSTHVKLFGTLLKCFFCYTVLPQVITHVKVRTF